MRAFVPFVLSVAMAFVSASAPQLSVADEWKLPDYVAEIPLGSKTMRQHFEQLQQVARQLREDGTNDEAKSLQKKVQQLQADIMRHQQELL